MRNGQLSVSANQKDGGELRRQIVHFAHVKQAKIEFVELTAFGKRDQSNAHTVSRFFAAGITVEVSVDTKVRVSDFTLAEKQNPCQNRSVG